MADDENTFAWLEHHGYITPKRDEHGQIVYRDGLVVYVATEKGMTQDPDEDDPQVEI